MRLGRPGVHRCCPAQRCTGLVTCNVASRHRARGPARESSTHSGTSTTSTPNVAGWLAADRQNCPLSATLVPPWQFDPATFEASRRCSTARLRRRRHPSPASIRRAMIPRRAHRGSWPRAGDHRADGQPRRRRWRLQAADRSPEEPTSPGRTRAHPQRHQSQRPAGSTGRVFGAVRSASGEVSASRSAGAPVAPVTANLVGIDVIGQRCRGAPVYRRRTR